MVGRAVKTIDVTEGERLRVMRRRAGLKRQEVAQLLGVSAPTARKWELAEADASPLELQAHEWCLLMRERHGSNLGDLSAMLGLGVPWLSRAERGLLKPEQITVLVKFWERNR